jgi:hypothetical protein
MSNPASISEARYHRRIDAAGGIRTYRDGEDMAALPWRVGPTPGRWFTPKQKYQLPLPSTATWPGYRGWSQKLARGCTEQLVAV